MTKHIIPHLLRSQHVFVFIICGALTTAAFAPYFIVPILFITIPIVLNFTKNATSGKNAFFIGFWFGFGHFCSGIYWLAHALLVDAATYGWLIPFAILGIGAGLACYIGLTTLCSYYVRHLSNASFTIAFALSWTLFEAIRSTFLTGFPWNLMGYVWSVGDATAQAASIGGIIWLSMLTIIIAGLPFWAKQAKIMAALSVVMLTILVGWGHMRLSNHPTIYNETVKLRIVQAAIPQALKWNPKQRIDALNTHLAMSMSDGYERLTHIIWPETAMTYQFREGDFWSKELAYLAPLKGSLITGVVRSEQHETETAPMVYNSIQAITHDGVIDAVYDKQHLVPFGEYVPLRRFLPLEKITHGSVDFSSGTVRDVLQTKGAPPFKPLICYESIFPSLSHDAYPAWILNVTNDGWFGESIGPYHHFHMARMRAIEQGVPLVRAANTGVSAVFDAYGRILHYLPLNEKGVIDSALPQPAPKATLYNRYGYVIIIMTIALLLIVLAYDILILQYRKNPNGCINS